MAIRNKRSESTLIKHTQHLNSTDYSASIQEGYCSQIQAETEGQETEPHVDSINSQEVCLA